MISELVLPVLEQTGGEFLLVKWFKREGDAVHAGEPLCEIEVSKANTDLEASADGMLSLSA
ncbi:MAG: hypothetical protein HY326_08240 [Chloroflexi bacterium]|nr:hypothetical protein [Chloroflexota bacterium]